MVNEDFFQPPFYHFNEDSIALSKLAIEYANRNRITNYLDAGAGCGVIAIEVLRNSEIAFTHLVEKQEAFNESIQGNLKKYISEKNVKITIGSILNIEEIETYDLITINPPYFNNKNSRPSHLAQKNICRLYDETELSNLFEKLISLLSANGIIFFSFRKNEISVIQKVVDKMNRRLNLLEELNGASLFSII